MLFNKKFRFMKNLLYSSLVVLFVLIFFAACENPEVDTKSSVPIKFKVDVPSSISNASVKKSAQDDSLAGNDLYEHLRTFVWLGESSADFVQSIMTAIQENNIDREMSFSDVSKEDGRLKTFTVKKDVKQENANWDFEIDIDDPDGIAAQIVWNNSPVKGFAIINLYNSNRSENHDPNAMIRIDYSEAGDIQPYSNYMIVSISGLDVSNNFDINALKMFVGKNGNNIDVFGNSNHPKMKLFDLNYNDGYNWAFVARSNEALDVAVAKVGLTPCNYNELGKIFTDYSFKNTLGKELHALCDPYVGVWFVDQQAADNHVNSYLVDAEAPAYFNPNGFISCGQNVPNVAGFTTEFINLNNLNPYIPQMVNDLEIKFLSKPVK